MKLLKVATVALNQTPLDWLGNAAHIRHAIAAARLQGASIICLPELSEWPSGTMSTIELDGETFPIGSLVFDFEGVRVGFEICEDAWAASRPGSELSQAAVDLVLNPSASHFAFGKQEVRRRLVLESSRAFGVTYLDANLLGNEAGRVIYDGATTFSELIVPQLFAHYLCLLT